MTLPSVRTVNEWVVPATTLSIGSSPSVAVCVAPVKGHIVRTGMASCGALTGTTTATVIITPVGGSAGSDIGTGALSLAAGTNIVAIDRIEGINSASTAVGEGDTITFTPSGGTGSSIGGNFWAVIREQG